MKRSNKYIVGWGIPLVLLLIVIWTVRNYPSAGEWYAGKVYPVIASVLSAVSSWVPFSLGDLSVVFITLGTLIYIVYAIYRRYPFGRTFLKVAIFLGYVYVWFYLAWGLNYFRKDFYSRTEIPYMKYDSAVFKSFLDDYVKGLNDSYVVVEHIDTALVQQEVKAGYNRIASEFGMIDPRKVYEAKPMLSSALMSKTGVLGYMEPFFAEFCINEDLLLVQYPQTYAHELSHRLSISSEAEANLYAYLVCTASDVPAIKFSGYFSLFPYVMVNAAMALPEEEYKAILKKVNPEIIELYKQKQAYWDARYSKLIGEVQHKVYNFFLKGNNIKSGTANYSEVVGLLISYQNARK